MAQGVNVIKLLFVQKRVLVQNKTNLLLPIIFVKHINITSLIKYMKVYVQEIIKKNQA